jgi:hypothetical protein
VRRRSHPFSVSSGQALVYLIDCPTLAPLTALARELSEVAKIGSKPLGGVVRLTPHCLRQVHKGHCHVVRSRRQTGACEIICLRTHRTSTEQPSIMRSRPLVEASTLTRISFRAIIVSHMLVKFNKIAGSDFGEPRPSLKLKVDSAGWLISVVG